MSIQRTTRSSCSCIVCATMHKFGKSPDCTCHTCHYLWSFLTASAEQSFGDWVTYTGLIYTYEVTDEESLEAHDFLKKALRDFEEYCALTQLYILRPCNFNMRGAWTGHLVN